MKSDATIRLVGYVYGNYHDKLIVPGFTRTRLALIVCYPQHKDKYQSVSLVSAPDQDADSRCP
jgi:hypothetical protein